MTIGIIGTGGVGGYFGGKLTRLLKNDVDLRIYFIARNRHLEEIKKNGLILDTDEGTIVCKPTAATDDISALPELDICLICVKSYDLDNVLKQILVKVTEKTVILPLLNGVDIYERIRGVISRGIVFPSCVYVGTHIEKPGKVTQRGGSCTILFGNDPEKSKEDNKKGKVLRELFERAGIQYVWKENPYPDIWSKFIFIAAFGLVTAQYNKTLGQVMESPELSDIVKQIMEEIAAIAFKKGIDIPNTIVADSLAKGNTFPFNIKTSFQRDYEIMDKPDERDLFGGAVIRMGKDVKVHTEKTSRLYNLLREKKGGTH